MLCHRLSNWITSFSIAYGIRGDPLINKAYFLDALKPHKALNNLLVTTKYEIYKKS